MAKESPLSQLFKECEEYIIQSESPNASLMNFLTKQTKINKKYLNILRKKYLKLIKTNSMLLLVTTIFLLIQLIISITYISKTLQMHLILIISESITLFIFSLFLILIHVQRIREAVISPFVFVWTIYIICYANILLLIYSYGNNGTLQHVFIHKFYFYLISSHLIFSLFMNVNMSLHFGHFIVLIGLDLLLIIVLNITYTFYYQSFSIVLFGVYIMTSSYNTEVTQKGLYDFCVKKYYNFLINEEIIQNASIGVCLCKEDFEIKKSNKLFSLEMKDLMYTKERDRDKDRIGDNDKDKDRDKDKENEEDITKTHINVNSTNNHNSKSETAKFNNKELTNSYLNTIDLIKKFDCDSSDKKNMKITFSKAIDDETNFYVSNDKKNDMELFNALGRFKTRKNSSLYSVKWKRVYYHTNQSQKQHCKNMQKQSTANVSSFSNSFNYKFIFTEITKNRKYDRIKVEQIYQKLILAKISHEFNEPIALIQAKMDEVDLNYKKVFTKETNDDLNEVKYYAETILVSVRDLIEYINIHSANSNFEQKENKIYPLIELKNYCKNISCAYLNLMKRTMGIQVSMDESLDNDQIEIDDKKLNQILANLISNAIKNTENDDLIGINIIKMSSHDIKYFEFGANQNLYVNEDDNEDEQNKSKKKNLFNDANDNDANDDNDNEQCEIDLGLVIEIEDNGTGINSTLLKDINSEGGTFYRVDTNETKINNAEGYAQCRGLGSGLKICKKLTDDIGAKLKCELKKGNFNQGTIFRLYIKTEISPYHQNSNGNINVNNTNLQLLSPQSK